MKDLRGIFVGHSILILFIRNSILIILKFVCVYLISAGWLFLKMTLILGFRETLDFVNLTDNFQRAKIGRTKFER